MTDLHNNIKVARSISPLKQTNVSTAIVGQIVDHQGYDQASYIIAYGDLTDINVTFTTLLEEGDAANLSDAVSVADADLLGTEAGATPLFSDDNRQFKLGYKGIRRYTRLTVTPVGNDLGDIHVAACCVLGAPRSAPQPAQKT